MDALLVVMFGATGIVFVFFPDLTNRIARWVGVGRGADMIFYLAIVFFLFVVAKLYGRIRKLEQQLTEIVRDESIRKAREGTSKGKQEDSNP